MRLSLSLSLRRLESLHIQGNGIKRLPHTVVNLKKINSLLVLPNPIEVQPHSHARRLPPVTHAHCSPSRAPHTHLSHPLTSFTTQLALLFGSFLASFFTTSLTPTLSLSPHFSRIHPKTLFASVHRACCSTLPTTTQTDSCRHESFLISVGGAVGTATVVTTM